MKQILCNVFSGKQLKKDEILKFLELINEEKIPSEQAGALLGAISARSLKENLFETIKGASAQEIADFSLALKKYSTVFNLKSDKPFMDVCGTGGDCLNSFNISTIVAIVLASCGAKIIKHGNRSISGNCGSADVLEKLGVKLELTFNEQQKSLDENNIVFLFAPNYNSCMAKIKKIRNSISAPTIFNLLGPLINPINLDYQIVGVFDETKCKILAQALLKMGVKKAMVVHSKEGMDELSLNDFNTVYHLENKKVKKIKLPSIKSLGLKYASVEEYKGGSIEENAKIALDILNGEEKGAKRDIVLLNSAIALVVYGIARNIAQGVEIAKDAINSKKALKVLEGMKNVSR